MILVSLLVTHHFILLLQDPINPFVFTDAPRMKPYISTELVILNVPSLKNIEDNGTEISVIILALGDGISIGMELVYRIAIIL